MAKLIAKRYAKALFELAIEEQKIQDYYAQFQFVVEILQKEKEFASLLVHPQILKEEKKTILKEVFKDAVEEELKSFLQIVVDKNREKYIEDIFREFETLVNKKQNIETAYIITAETLSSEQIETLKKQLEHKTKKTIQMNITIDPKVIGGLSVRMGDMFIDGTIIGKIKKAKETLMGVQLAKEGV